MIRKLLLLFNCVLINTSLADGLVHRDGNIENVSPTQVTSTETSFIGTTQTGPENDLVKIQLYYECLCPDCRMFDSMAFKQTVLELGSHLDIHLYPYGKARTVDKGDGNYKFFCQHGPAECYGNKLHACAIDVLQNITMAVLYNSCLMDYSQADKGSDDVAADVCGKSMSIDSESIKECAKGSRGSVLLKLYGEKSKKVFKFVPYILINGTPTNSDQFKKDVCKAIKNPPSQCNKYL